MSRTHVGLRRRVNEDSLLVAGDRGLWVVADGMGGHEAGDVASAMIVDALAELPRIADPERRVGAAIEALAGVNAQLVELAGSGGHRTIGSTVVGLCLADGEFRCFWAGDSRCYLIREGEIFPLSRDHSLVQELIEAGLLDPAQAAAHPDASVITRAVGASPRLVVDQICGELWPGDLFLLASDGLTRLVNDPELLAELESRPAGEAADRLIDLVLARGAPDNVTLIIVRAG